jgi:hypothetical protein
MNFTTDLHVVLSSMLSVAITFFRLYFFMARSWAILTFALTYYESFILINRFSRHILVVLWYGLILLHQVKQFALVLWSRDLNPDKYETLCRMMSKTYCKTGSPVSLLQLYLSVVTRGSCTTEENGTFLVRDFEARSNHNNQMLNTRVRGQFFHYHWMVLENRVVRAISDLRGMKKQQAGENGTLRSFVICTFYHMLLR